MLRPLSFPAGRFLFIFLSSLLFSFFRPPFSPFFLFSSFLRYFGRVLNARPFPRPCRLRLSGASEEVSWLVYVSWLRGAAQVVPCRGSMSNRRRKRNRFISRFNSAKWSNFAIDLSGSVHKTVPYPRAVTRAFSSRAEMNYSVEDKSFNVQHLL